MSPVYQGTDSTPDGRFAVVVSRFNELVTKKLLDGATAALARRNVADDAVDVVWVPGAFEIPLVANRLAASGRYAAVICLGAVIRGETTHHEYINREVSAGIRQAAVATGVPVLFGVLTCETLSQALDRAGGKVGNKGAEAAEAAVEMVNLLKQLPGGSPPRNPC